MRKLSTFLLMWLVIGMQMTWAQFTSAPAFPGAEGYGRYVTGGRGGTIYHVTTLEDSTSPTAGMLRYAINKSGARTIVFDVAGTIYLKDVLKINSGNLTILGQTAPGDGICIAGYPVKTGAANSVGASNIIIRYVRFRMGDINGVDDDALSASRSDGSQSTGIIIDHCSISWCTDEVGSFYGNKNFTLQWCILSEALNKNVAKASDHSVAHGYGAIWGGQNASFHHNLLAHNQSRNPRFDHDYVSTLRGPIDYVNNCVYNWGNYAAYGGESCNSSGSYRKINMIGNYYKAGPATPSSKASNLLRITTTCSNCTKSQSCSTIVPAHFYMSGNNISGVLEDGSMGITVSDYTSSSRFKASDSQWDYNTISIHSSSDAFTKVLAYAGASYARDAIDTRIVSEATNGTANYTGTYSKTAGIIDSQSEVEGWPTLSGTKATDTDNDGIPDDWEDANGLNKNSASDAITYTLDSKGYYTNLEVYANSLVETAIKAGRSGASETFTEYYPSVSSTASTATEGTIIDFNLPSSSVPSNGATATDTEDFGAVTVTYTNASMSVASTGLRFGSNSDQVTFSLPSGVTFQSGDVITVAFMPQSTSKNVGFTLTSGSATATTTTAMKSAGAQTSTFTVGSSISCAGQSSLAFKRAGGGSVDLTTVTVVRGSSATTTSSTATTTSSTTTSTNTGYYMVTAGSASSLLSCIEEANSAASSSSRAYVFIPNGTYDLGTTTLTQVSGYVSLIGESQTGVLIKNTPTTEGISITATLLPKGNEIYMQDLSISCIAPYGSNNGASAERGVAIQDKGNKTAYYNVSLLGLQDTYYSNGSEGMRSYWKNSYFEGTVDYICGYGNVLFQGCTFMNVARSTGSGADVIFAPNTYASEMGYIFNECVIDGIASQDGTFSLGRPWLSTRSGVCDSPAAAYLNCTFKQEPLAAGWTKWNDNDNSSYTVRMWEYGSKDASGNSLTLSSRSNAAFNAGSSTYSAVASASDASARLGYLKTKLTGSDSWDYDGATTQKTVTATSNGLTITMSASSPKAYLIEKDDAVVAITTSNTYTVPSAGTYVVRAANSMGGFGVGAKITVTSSGTASSTALTYSVYRGSSSSSSSSSSSTTSNSVSAKTTFTWDFSSSSTTPVTSTLEGSSAYYASTSTTVSGTTSSIYANATSGKVRDNGNSVSLNSGTILRVPVGTTSDVVTVVAYGSYYNYTVGGTAASATTTTHTATSSEVSKGYVEIVATGSAYITKITALRYPNTTAYTYSWDFANCNPSTLSSVSFNGTSGTVTSSSSNSTTVNLTVNASSGKFAYRSANGDVQMNSGTTVKVPVVSTSDVVTVATSYGNANLTINGTAMSSASVSHTATSTEVSQGYVLLSATATVYLTSISVKQYK